MADMRKAFLADIIENIDDDTPRLVFADWLEDNGDPDRAEFIRLQCRQAAEESWPLVWHQWNRHGPLTDRGKALIAEHGGEWMKEAPKWATKRFGFYRGFVGRVEVTGREWLNGVAGLYRRVPVEGLKLRTGDDAFLAAFAARPECGSLRQLDFHTCDNSAEALAQLFATGNFRRLITLDCTLYSKGIYSSGIEILGALLASVHMTRVRFLVLRNGRLGVEGAAMLAASGLLSNLKSLQMCNTGITAAGVAELARSPNASTLEVLSLRANDLGDEGVVALAESPYLSNLRTLHINREDISLERAVHALATSSSLERLTELQLGYIRDKPGTAEAIAESESLIHLRRLHLNYDNDYERILTRLAERRRERGIE